MLELENKINTIEGKLDDKINTIKADNQRLIDKYMHTEIIVQDQLEQFLKTNNKKFEDKRFELEQTQHKNHLKTLELLIDLEKKVENPQG